MKKYITYLLHALKYSVLMTLLSWLLLGGFAEALKYGFDWYHVFGMLIVLLCYTSTFFGLIWYASRMNDIIDEHNEEVKKARLIEKWKP